MVTAYNLHFDILGLIFSCLSGNDLVSVSLVSKAFHNGVTPRLYHTLVFSHAQAKKFPKIVSPFSSLLAQPSLGVYVRVCEITAFPLYKGLPNQTFLSECIRALDICPNLTRFRLAPNVLPSFLTVLLRKDKLKDLHVNGSLTIDQAEILTSVKGLRSIRLDHASWCLMNVFPRWMSVLGPTLAHLTFTLTSELNDSVLEEILVHLPNLRGLHVRNCMKIDHNIVFRLLSHTPQLESLSVTSWENPTTTFTPYASVRNLRYLHLDARNAVVPASIPPIWSSIIAHTKVSQAPLTSLTLQLMDSATIPFTLIEEIVDAHAETLTSLRLVRVWIAMGAVELLARKCRRLERLALQIYAKDVRDLADALSKSSSLKVLIDEPDPHSVHGQVATLKHEDVKTLMAAIPTLRLIHSDSRVWRGSGDDDNLQITLERLKYSQLPNVITFP